jgi:hypothetical protein
MIRVDGQRVNPCVTSAIQTARSIHSRKPSERLPMLPPKLGTSNIRTPGTCHACSRKVPSERANLTPPPCRLMSQVGKRVAQHARPQSRARTNQMLPALARRSSTSAGKRPDAEVPPLPASLARRRSSTSADKPCPTQKFHAGSRGPSKLRRHHAQRNPGSSHCRHRSPTQKTTKRYVDQIDK